MRWQQGLVCNLGYLFSGFAQQPSLLLLPDTQSNSLLLPQQEKQTRPTVSLGLLAQLTQDPTTKPTKTQPQPSDGGGVVPHAPQLPTSFNPQSPSRRVMKLSYPSPPPKLNRRTGALALDWKADSLPIAISYIYTRTHNRPSHTPAAPSVTLNLTSNPTRFLLLVCLFAPRTHTAALPRPTTFTLQ